MDVAFFLKKLIGQMLMPLPMCLLVIVMGVLLLRRTNKTLGVLVCSFGVLVLALLSTGPIANAVLRPLENAFPKYDHQKIEYVLVLGGGHNTDSTRPLSSVLSRISLMRLIEGVMIYRANPGAMLLLSGYAGSDPESHARAAARVAQALDVPESDITLAEYVKDTAEEAAHWVKYTDGKPLALVTSASHMPRSVFLFEREIEKNGGDVSVLVPAPTAFIAPLESPNDLRAWIPKARNLTKVAIAWHEYLGRFWAGLQ